MSLTLTKDHVLMSDFDRYEELNLSPVARFSQPYLSGPVVEAKDVSGGNINRVFRVLRAGSSVIVKQAIPYLRAAGKGWPLTRHRIETENLALEIHGALVPRVMPEVFCFDHQMFAIVMEDLKSLEPWREAMLLDGHTTHVPIVIAEYCSQILIKTSALVLDPKELKELRAKFSYTELCLVTEELFFTAPYVESKLNRFESGLAPLVVDLQADEVLRAAASEMRTIFKTKTEALIHGDLHSGSIMFSGSEVRIIDLEFAFYGPFGFDLGVLFANLALSKIAQMARGDFNHAWMTESYAKEIWESFCQKILGLASIYGFNSEKFLFEMEGDMYRFAGMEMIRRIIGLAHAKEIDSLSDQVRLSGQKQAIRNGRRLLVNSSGFDFEQFWKTATREVSVS